MKAILISIKPKYVADILNHKKTIEVRKSMPKCDLPIDVYIYCTKEEELFYSRDTQKWFVAKNRKNFKRLSNGVVKAKFTLNKVEETIEKAIGVPYFTTPTLLEKDFCKKSHLTPYDINEYLKGKKGYAWHISNLEIFDRPKELSGGWFTKRDCRTCPFNYEDMDGDECIGCIIEKAPQSWCYVEVE